MSFDRDEFSAILLNKSKLLMDFAQGFIGVVFIIIVYVCKR